MKTTELTDIERAPELPTHVLARAGDSGEHLTVQVRPPGVGPDAHMDMSGTGDWQRNLVQRRLAVSKSLRSARDLLNIAQQLMSVPEGRSSRDFTAQKKAMLEEIRRAARRTYEAGHLLIGVEMKP